MHPTDSRVHTYKLTRAFLEVEYLKEMAVTSKGESSEVVFMMTELESDSEIDCEILLVSPALQFSLFGMGVREW